MLKECPYLNPIYLSTTILKLIKIFIHIISIRKELVNMIFFYSKLFIASYFKFLTSHNYLRIWIYPYFFNLCLFSKRSIIRFTTVEVWSLALSQVNSIWLNYMKILFLRYRNRLTYSIVHDLVLVRWFLNYIIRCDIIKWNESFTCIFLNYRHYICTILIIWL